MGRGDLEPWAGGAAFARGQKSCSLLMLVVPAGLAWPPREERPRM